MYWQEDYVNYKTMKDKIIEILGKEIWISEDYDARKDKSQYFIEGIDNATDELLTLFNSEIAKRDQLIRLQDMSYCNLMDWFENGSVYDHNKERLAMDEQINKLKAEIE